MKNLLLITLLFFSSCNTQKDLRGKYKNSKDNKTYLVIEDNNGGDCGNIYIDGELWIYPLGHKGPIDAGRHSIICSEAPETEGLIYFEIIKGTTYRFNYWGP